MYFFLISIQHVSGFCRFRIIIILILRSRVICFDGVFRAISLNCFGIFCNMYGFGNLIKFCFVASFSFFDYRFFIIVHKCEVFVETLKNKNVLLYNGNIF